MPTPLFKKGHRSFGRALFGHKTSEITKNKIREKRIQFIKNNPDWFDKINRISFKGENNPNWRGGITKEYQKWHSSNSHKFKKHREAVLKRDDYTCKKCGSKNNLEVHHIVPICELKEAAFIRMNGITLCDKCHHKTDSYGGKSHKDFSIGKIRCIIKEIPHKFQDYDTVGNYQWTKSGVLIIFVSKQKGYVKTEEELMGVIIHEYIEALLCKKRKIKTEDIDKWDLQHQGDYEPGEVKGCCYFAEHKFANKIEKLFLKELKK